MKNFKKLMALVIAMVMVLGTMSVFAAPGDMNTEPDSTVKVTGLTAGDSVAFYQVIEWKGVTADNKTDEKNVGGWYAVAPFDTVLTPAVLKQVLVDGKTATQEDVDAGLATEVGGKIPLGITSELAGQLARAAATANPKTTVTATTEASINIGTGDGKYPQGMYMALITPTKVDDVYNPVFVSSDYFDNDSDEFGAVTTATYSDKAAAKKSTLTLTKTAENAADYNNDNGQTTKVGDILTFTVTTTIPGFGEVYENPVFDVSDTLTDLELTEIVSVKTGSPLADAIGNTTIAPSTVAGSDNFTVSFKPAYLKTLKTATPVEIVYKAKVTSTATKNVNEEDNQVEIKYSHNPKDTTGKDLKAKKDTTQHYTFTIDADLFGLNGSQTGKSTSEIVKVGVDAAGKPITEKKTTSQIDETKWQQSPLAGAKFALYTTENDAKNDTNRYTNPTFGGEVTTTADGRMKISGLDAGTYYLKEISAPAGFIKDPSVHTIEITATMQNKDITEWYKVDPTTGDVDWKQAETTGYTAFTYNTDVLQSYTVKMDGTTAAQHWYNAPANSVEVLWNKDSEGTVEIPQSIVNTKGVELPSTGGMGTTLFYAIGAVLVLGAGVLLVSRRRMSAN